MKKPTKEQRRIWSRRYSEKNKESISNRRKVLNPKKSNTDYMNQVQKYHDTRRMIFNKSYFGKLLKKRNLTLKNKV